MSATHNSGRLLSILHEPWAPNIEAARAPWLHELSTYSPQADSVVIGVVSSSWLSREAHTLKCVCCECPTQQ